MTDKSRIKDALNEACILGFNADNNEVLGELFTEFFAADTMSSSDSEGEEEEPNSDAGTDGAEAGYAGADSVVESMEIDSDSDTEPIVGNIIDAVGVDDKVSPDAEEEMQKIRNFKFNKCRCRNFLENNSDNHEQFAF